MAWPRRRHLDVVAGPRGVHGRGRRGPRAHPRRRCLPGQRLPGAVGCRRRRTRARSLAAALAAGNPAPFAGVVHVPAGAGVQPVWVVTASPELFLRLADGVVTSGPIKGTATTADALSAKDERRERHDRRHGPQRPPTRLRAGHRRGHRPAGVRNVTPAWCTSSRPAGLSTRSVVAAPDLWEEILDATYPPASVSGAPKSAALGIIEHWSRDPAGPTAAPSAGSTSARRHGAAAGGRHPHVLVVRRGAALRYRRRDHLGERRRGRVARDRAEGRAAGRAGLRLTSPRRPVRQEADAERRR